MPWHSSFGLFISDEPVRKTVRRSSPFANDKVPTRKRPGTMIHCESTNETALARLAEFDPTVLAYFGQPLCLDLTVRGKPARYTPDFAVIFDEHVEIHEVKSDKHAGEEDVLALAMAAAEAIEAAGGRFSLTTRSMLLVEPRYRNIGQALRRLHDHVDDGLRIILLDRAHALPGATVSEVAKAALPHSASPENVLTLIARGDLRVDLAEPVGLGARVWAPEHFQGEHRVLPFRSPGWGPCA